VQRCAQKGTWTYAPGADVASYLRGDVASRFGRFDFIQDELAGGAD